MRYNEKPLPNGTVIYSSEKKPEKYSCWGLYDKATGSDLVEPKYDKVEAWGDFNGEPVVFLSQYGGDKKIYLVKKHKLLFSDGIKILGKEWNQIPELHSAVYGNVYYVIKDKEYCLVDENENVVLHIDNLLRGNLKMFDHQGKSYLITLDGIYELGSNKPFDPGIQDSKVVDAFSLEGNLFFICSKMNRVILYFVYGVEQKKKICDIDYIMKDKWAICSKKFYIKDDDVCRVYDKDGNPTKYEIEMMGSLIKMDDRVIVGAFKKQITVDVETGKMVMDGFAVVRIENSRLIMISNRSGLYRGIKDFDTNGTLALPIFDGVVDGAIVKCSLGDEKFLFDKSKKSFIVPSTFNLIKKIFTLDKLKERI